MVAVVSVLAMMVVPPASAATPANPLLTGNANNSTSLSGAVSVAVQTTIAGTYAYSPSYYSGVLTAVDISNPAAPVVTGQSTPVSPPAPNPVLNASTVNIAGGFAYVVSKNANGPCLPGPSPMCGSGTNDDGKGGNSLSIFNISTNPAVPTFVGSVTDSTKLFGAYGVAIGTVGSKTYAYVAAQGCLSPPQPCPDPTVGNRFEVVDVSTPASPTIVASVTNPASGPFANALNHATSVAISGHYAFVTAFNSNRLTIIDILNATSPMIVASLPGLSNPSDVTVSSGGHYAYVANQSTNGPVTVVDVSTPTSPQVVGSVTNAALNGAYRIRLHGNFAYVSGSSSASIAAVDISDPAHPSVAGSLTDTGHLHTTTGLDVDASGHYVVAASPYALGQNKPTFPPYTPGTGGPTLTGTISAIQIDPVAVGVTIMASPANPTPQTSASFTFSRTDAVASTSCSLDSATPAPCTSATTQTYSGLSPGSHTFIVTVTDAAGNPNAASYTWTITAPPVNHTLPSISGTASVGQTLTAFAGGWTGSPQPGFTYQWSDCDAAGANCTTIGVPSSSAGYVVRASDLASTLRVTVVATNTVGSAAATSAQTGVVVAAPPVQTPPVNTALPSISGTATQGQTLTASNGTWTGSPAPTFTYQWVVCDSGGANCSAVSGATQTTHPLGGGEVGHTLRVFVIGTNTAAATRAISLATAVVTAPSTAPSTAPTITGLRQAAKTWRESGKPRHTKPGQRKPKHLPTGTTFSLTLDKSAGVTFSFTLDTSGRKVKHRCRTQTAQNRHEARCTIKLGAGSLTVSARKGTNKIKFSGRVSHGKKLRPGSYTVTITATASGKRSNAKTLSFTVAP